MSDPAYDPPPSPPPPSYEISQHEFDQKTSRILEQSAAEPPPRRVDKDGFEIWDEAVFEAQVALNTLSLGQSSQSNGKAAVVTPAHSRQGSVASSSANHASPPPFVPSSQYGSSYPPEKPRARRQLPQLPSAGGASGHGSRAGSDSGSSLSPPSSPPQSVRPTRVSRRAPTKERPSWYAEAGLGGSSPPMSPLQSSASSSSGSSSAQQERPLRRQLTVFNNTEREVTPPPEFTAVGPSLDGPPYETIVMTYEGEPPPPAAGILEPPISATPPPPGDFATPQPQRARTPASTVASHAPVPRPSSGRPHPPHAQSLPQRPSHATPSPRPHAVHAQSMPAGSSVSMRRDGAALRASAFEPAGQLSNAPRLSFNPQMAYTKPVAPTMAARSEDAELQAVNPTAFYR